MADRTVRVRLGADISDYLAKMQQAAAATEKTATKNSAAWGKVSTGLLGIGAAALAGVGVAVKGFADFDSAMSNVKATGQDAATNITALRDAAMKAGKEFGQFSATDAAEGIEALAKAGVSAAEVLNGGLNGALNLAAAGQIEVGQAAEITAMTLAQFQLKGKDAAKVADLLAAGAGKAVGEVTDMAAALKMSGTVAHQYGISVEETTGVLALFAQNALIGSDAGTSMKQMLLQLASPTKEAQAELAKYNITAYDAKGQFVGMASLAEQLKTKLGGLSQEQQNAALKTIFGADAIRSAAILMREGGASVQQWTKDVSEQGYAAQVAGTKMDNLKGDLAALGGSWETLTIKMGSSGDGPLRGAVKALSGLLDVISDMSPKTQTAILAAGTLVGITALVGGGAMKAVTGVVELKAALTALGISAKTATLSMGAIGIILTAATLALGGYLKRQAEHKALVDQLTFAIEANNGALGKNVTAIMAKQLADDGTLQKAKELGLNLQQVTAAAAGNQTALSAVNAELERLSKADPNAKGLQSGSQAMYNQVTAARSLKTTLGELNGTTSEAQAKARLQAEATGEAGKAADGAKKPIAELGTEMGSAASKTEQLANELTGLTTKMLALTGSEIATKQAIADFNTKLAENTKKLGVRAKTLDTNTQLGRDNTKMIMGIVSAYDSEIKSLKEAGAGTAALNAKDRERRTAIEAVIKSLGLNAAAAKKLRQELGLIPSDVNTRVNQPGGKEATAQAKALADAYKALPGAKATAVSAPGARPSKAQVDAFMASLKGVPPEKRSAIRTIAELAGVEAAKRAISSVQDKTVTVWVKAGGVGGALGAINAIGKADGGILRYYANGGMERHVAQIAPAGAWRVWAEDETGGEAYIPLAPSKRRRSLDILEEVAAIFGHQLLPNASGNVYAAPSIPSRMPAPSVPRSITYQASTPDPSQWRITLEVPGLAGAVDARIVSVTAGQDRGADLSSRLMGV